MPESIATRDATRAPVRQRIIEFLGGDTLERSTCAYITNSDGCRFVPDQIRQPGDLDWFLERDLDVARSLHDRSDVLVHLDVEYVHFDSPAEAFIDPWRTFDLQEPVIATIEEILLDWGIRPLHLITGQGHHFVWKIRRRSALAKKIAELNPLPERTRQFYAKSADNPATAIEPDVQDAFAGLALLMEYLAYQIKFLAAPKSDVPVEITAVHVGPAATGQREMISIDISEYGDPVHTRMIRTPFSTYLKPWRNGMADGQNAEDQIPHFRTIPLHEIDVRQALVVRQDENAVAELARRSFTRIPEETKGTAALFAAYLASDLKKFHDYFYSEDHDPPENWPATYNRTPLERLPPCARTVLSRPNDLLLKPAGIQLVTRCLLADGWHPRHVAGLIRSKFEEPYFGWGDEWTIYDPATRADFYTRLFSGLQWTGLDRLVDFNCFSNQEKGFCFGAGCSLESSRHNLLERKYP